MYRFFSFFGVDLRRSLTSTNILISSIATTFFLLLSVFEDMKGFWSSGKIDIIYLYNTAINSDLSIIILVLGAIPFASSFLEDMESNFLTYVICRGNTFVYCLSKIVTCMFVGVMSIVIGQVLFIISLMPFFNIYESILYE